MRSHWLIKGKNLELHNNIWESVSFFVDQRSENAEPTCNRLSHDEGLLSQPTFLFHSNPRGT